MSVAARAWDVSEELSRVVESGDVEAVARLLPRVADLNARNRHGATVLMTAARCGHAQVVRLLLEHGADPNLMRNDKFTALALAAFFGHTETVKTLMEFGARTEAVTRSGASAQTWATARTFAEVARCLNTPSPKTTQPAAVVQLPRRSSRSRILPLGVLATLIVIVCCALGAKVLRSSEARHLPTAVTAPPQPPPQVENRVIDPEPQPPAPEAVVNEAPVESTTSVESRTANPVRHRAPPPRREEESVSVLNEQPPAEEVKVSEPPKVVAKPKVEPPKPPALSPQILAPTKKAKVIQWP